MYTILIVILVLLLIGALPNWGYSRGWGYFPSGGLGLVLLIDHSPAYGPPLRGACFRRRRWMRYCADLRDCPGGCPRGKVQVWCGHRGRKGFASAAMAIRRTDGASTATPHSPIR